MFNPLKVILKEDDTIDVFRNSNVIDYYHDNVNDVVNVFTTCKLHYNNIKKKVIEQSKDQNFTPELTTSQLISKKVQILSKGVFDCLQGKVTDNSKKLLQYVYKTKDQVYILKKIFSNPNNSPVANKIYFSDGIGFKTTELPLKENYVKAGAAYNKAWHEKYPLYDDMLWIHFPTYYRSEEELNTHMHEHIDYYFKADKGYRAKEYVDIFDEMNQSMISMLKDHKEKYASIRGYLNHMNEASNTEYHRVITTIKASSMSKEEKEYKTSLATHNYKVFSSFLITMIDLVSVYHRIQLKILLMSYENYKNIIQKIFDDNMKG